MIDIVIGTVVVLTWNGYLFYKMKKDERGLDDTRTYGSARVLPRVQVQKDEGCSKSDDNSNV